MAATRPLPAEIRHRLSDRVADGKAVQIAARAQVNPSTVVLAAGGRAVVPAVGRALTQAVDGDRPSTAPEAA